MMDSMRATCGVRLFALPGTKCGVKADVEVAWSDKRGNVGIRFTKIAAQMQSTLRIWLAQQYFAT